MVLKYRWLYFFPSNLPFCTVKLRKEKLNENPSPLHNNNNVLPRPVGQKVLKEPAAAVCLLKLSAPILPHQSWGSLFGQSIVLLPASKAVLSASAGIMIWTLHTISKIRSPRLNLQSWISKSWICKI